MRKYKLIYIFHLCLESISIYTKFKQCIGRVTTFVFTLEFFPSLVHIYHQQILITFNWHTFARITFLFKPVKVDLRQSLVTHTLNINVTSNRIYLLELTFTSQYKRKEDWDHEYSSHGCHRNPHLFHIYHAHICAILIPSIFLS